MRKKVLCIILAVMLITSLSLGLAGCQTNAKVETFTTSNASGVSVGIISDTQLPGSGAKTKEYYNYIDALKILKDRNVDTILFAGDVSDTMTKGASKLAKEAWVEVFGAIESGPIKNYIMGNHDYWLPNFFDCWDIPGKGKMQKRFTKATGEKPNSHKVINGYHFINASPENGKMGGAYDGLINWIENEIKVAVAADSVKPIFVNTHFAPKGTVILSDEYGEAALHNMFKKYPQVVSVSGHSHGSLKSEKSIWQGEYTALQTQSLSYTCFDEVNLANQFTYDGLPSGMIVTADGKKMNIERLNMNTGKEIAQAWSVPMPIKDNLAKYSDETRKAAAETPTFTSNRISVVGYNDKYYLNFLPAKTNDVSIVKYYHIKVRNTDTQEYFLFNVDKESKDSLRYMSDFYTRKPGGAVVLEMKGVLPIGDYEIEVTAEEEFGKVSLPITTFWSVR